MFTDLPIMPGDSTKVGLGLWNSVPATLITAGLKACTTPVVGHDKRS